MSSLSLRFFFLNKLNNLSDFGIPATDSDSGSLQQPSLSSLSDYASAMFIYTGTSTLPTQSMAQVVQPTSMTNHVITSGLVPGSNHHVSGSGSLSISALNVSQSADSTQAITLFGNNLMADPPTSFMRGTDSLLSFLPNLANTPQAAPLPPTSTFIPTPTPMPTGMSSLTPVPAHSPPSVPIPTQTFVPTPVPTLLPALPPTPTTAPTPTPATAVPHQLLCPHLHQPPLPVPAPTLDPTLTPAPPPVQVPAPAVTPTPALTTAINPSVA
ncbi:hypothetical protein HD554DRAFT_2177387 [Boletus coccyginus]|nr:hypothetical protein HD554DRAFT_2177387 [Boletus coccyginus]